ncbi:MAG TPA: hypothetical protein EYM76_02900 [Candidatus Marinimicrobia bacterium]|nr:hypothetical protein [Candidatus Neomarinimicrobiota bacterium]
MVITVKILKFLPLLLLLSCIDLMIQEEKINSLYFNGGSWIEFGQLDSMKLESNDFTLQFWVSGGEVDTNEAPAIFSIIDSTDEITLAVLRDANQENSITTIINSTVGKEEYSWLDWSDPDNFYLISLLFSDSKGLKIYINDSNIINSESLIDVRGNKLNVGAIVNKDRTILENFWYGYIDEVRLWNTLLADSTILFQYAHPEKLGDYYRYSYYDSLIGLWRFNWDKPLYTIEDESDFNNDGIIYTLKGYSVELSEKGAQ